MKKLIFISLLFSILSLSVSAQKPTKAEKAAQLEQEFQQTRQLIESNHFQFELNRVYPQGGQDLSRFNPRGKFVITDSVAKGTLPFFGRAYSLPYGEGGGIEFDGVMKDQSLKIEHKKKRKILIYRFSITAKNDTYQISMEISGGGNCSVNLNSNNRAQISYSGTVSPVKDETGKSVKIVPRTVQPDIGITVQLRNKSLWYGKILFHRFALLGYLSLPDSPKQPTNHQFRHYKRKSRQQSVQNAIYDCNNSSHFLSTTNHSLQ